jgi:hypothetical protein
MPNSNRLPVQRHPKGRANIRRGAGTLGNHSAVVGLWDFDELKPGSLLARLQGVYFSGIDAVDDVEAFRKNAIASNKFTPNVVGR